MGKAGGFLKEKGVAPSVIDRVRIITEAPLISITRNNEKSVLCECTVLVSKEYIHLITKDNGAVFDIREAADDAKGFQCYVMAMMMEDADERVNTTTITFNRNSYIWKRQEMNQK